VIIVWIQTEGIALNHNKEDRTCHIYSTNHLSVVTFPTEACDYCLNRYCELIISDLSLLSPSNLVFIVARCGEGWISLFSNT
jgi:hypothetical protein